MTPGRKPRGPRIRRNAGLVFGLGAALLALSCGERVAESPALGEERVFRPPLAGVSSRLRFRVEPLAPGEVGADTLLPVYHRFLHRCSACHVAPSPRQLPAASWPRIVERMGRNIDAAGLLPLEEEDADGIVELMQRNAPEPQRR